MRTRGKGEGAVYPQCARKGPHHDEGNHRGCKVASWTAQIELPRSAMGKRRYARARRATKADALEALRELQEHARTGVVVDRSSTVASFIERWLVDVVPLSVTPGTVEAYAKVARNWITPYIGAVKLGDLTAGQIAGMLTRLEADGRSPRSRQYALTVLRRALRWAEQTRIVARNEASLVDGPKVPGRARDALTADEAKRVLDAAKGDRWEALATLALKLGLREGELLALRWDDVNLDPKRPEVTVVKGKTDASARTIPLVNGCAEVLRAHRQRQREERAAAGGLWRLRHQGNVFCWGDGRPLSRRSCLTWWHRLTAEALGERRRFHASRHTCAVLLLDAGVPLEIVSAVLGHANLAITSDLYARPTQDLKRRALVKLDDFLAEQA
jgi:integrase